MRNLLDPEHYKKRSKLRKTDVRGDYFRDQTAIIHSMPFRRLKHKTQVFFAPENDHVCTRIEHVLHVASIAATVCRGLNQQGWKLDEDLAYAIGLGHDLGHAPFGHSGEAALSKRLPNGKRFYHEINSYRMVEYLSRNGRGLNLCYAVKDGIIFHNGEKYEEKLFPREEVLDLDKIEARGPRPATFEGCIVRFSDKIAYLGRDIEDAITAGFIKMETVPLPIQRALGRSNGEIINTLVIDLIENSDKKGIGFSKKRYKLFHQLAEFNYQFIYRHPKLLQREEMVCNIILNLFDHFAMIMHKFGRIPECLEASEFRTDRAFSQYLISMHDFYQQEGSEDYQIIMDYISGMTDSYALECVKELVFPLPLKMYPF